MKIDRDSLLSALPILLIIILAASLRLTYFVQIQSNPLPEYMAVREAFDQYRFIEPVKEFLKGNWLGKPDIWCSPIYSYIIAALYTIFPQNINTIFLFQIILGILAVYVIYLAGNLLFGNKAISLIAAFALSIYSPAIYYECTVLRTPLITYMNLFGFFFLLKALKEDKARYILFGALALGLSYAIRTDLIALLLLVYIPFAVKGTLKKKMSYAGIFVLGFLISLSPLILRTALLEKKSLVESEGISTFWFGNTYDASGLDCAPRRPHSELVKESQGSIVKTVSIFLREIRQHPIEYHSLYLRKVRMFLNGYEIPANMSYDMFRVSHSALKAAFLGFSILAPFTILGLLSAIKLKDMGLLYIFLLALSAPVILFHIMSRYRMPAIPFFIIFAAYFLYRLIRMAREKKIASVSLAVISLAVIFLYTKPDEALIKRYFGSPIRCIDYGNMANAYISKAGGIHLSKEERDRFARAATIYIDKAIELAQTQYYFICESLLLGAVRYELGEYDEAKRAFDSVLKVEPKNEVARHYIGLMK